MKKRFLSVLLTAVLALSLTACGGSKTEEPAAAKNDFKVGLVTDVGGVEDQSFNQSAWEGLCRAEKDFGVPFKNNSYVPIVELGCDDYIIYNTHHKHRNNQARTTITHKW